MTTMASGNLASSLPLYSTSSSTRSDTHPLLAKTLPPHYDVPSAGTVVQVGAKIPDILPAVQYLSAAQGKHTYLLRSDGLVDRIRCCGRAQTLKPGRCHSRAGPTTKYIAVSAAGKVVYLLRDDGRVDRVRKCRKSTIVPPVGTRYTSVSAGPHSSYLLRDDGVVDHTCCLGKISKSLAPPKGTTFVGVSAGKSASFITRSDGVVERVSWGCKGLKQQAMESSEGYTSVSSQRKNYCKSSRVNLLVTGGGSLDVAQRNGTITNTIKPPTGLQYITANGTSLLRSDGAVDRSDRKFTGVSKTLTPPAGLKYVDVNGRYLVRSDGVVVRTNCRGNVSQRILVAKPAGTRRCCHRGGQATTAGSTAPHLTVKQKLQLADATSSNNYSTV